MSEKTFAFGVLFGNREGKRPLGRHRNRFFFNVNRPEVFTYKYRLQYISQTQQNSLLCHYG
jgi:hypothetical protein